MATATLPSGEEMYHYIANLGIEYNTKVADKSADEKFVLDRKNSPKAEFTRLAVKFYGWRGGDSLWNYHWERCFGEEYLYGLVWLDDADDTKSDSVALVAPPNAGASSISGSLSNSSWDITAGDPLPEASALDSPSDFTVPTTRREQREQRLQYIDNHMAQEYGVNYNKLAAWQKLCKDFGIIPAPQSITQCRKALKSKYINIFDFVEGHPHPFMSFHKFCKYTILGGKVYPLARAKQQSFTRALLHDISSSPFWRES